MRIYLERDGIEHEAKLPFNGADHVAVKDLLCPSCKAPLRAKGTDGPQLRDRDTYSSRAVSTCCGEAVGTICAQVSTIFGIEEDERVLHGRCRVY